MPNPYRKSFDAVRLFPFFIVYKDRKSPQRELPNHLHDWVEIVYVYEGKGNFFIDSNFYEMEQGDFFAIPANTIHRAFPDKDNPVRSTAIFFDPILLQTNSFHEQFSHTQLFEWCRNRRYYKLPLFPDHQKTIDDYIQTIYTEETLQEKGYHHSIIMNLKMLLLYITRKYVHFNEQPVARPETGLVWMNRAFGQIEQHLISGINLTELAQTAAVTPAHFSRVFKKLTGLNLIAYINHKRLNKARDLLYNTDYTINIIAEQCGFESLPHFHRTFKSSVHLTPAAFRKKARETDI